MVDVECQAPEPTKTTKATKINEKPTKTNPRTTKAGEVESRGWGGCWWNCMVFVGSVGHCFTFVDFSIVFVAFVVFVGLGSSGQGLYGPNSSWQGQELVVFLRPYPKLVDLLWFLLLLLVWAHLVRGCGLQTSAGQARNLLNPLHTNGRLFN